jgi:hypothetical protein
MAGGSIGSELWRQIVQLSPAMLVLYEQHEYALYALQRELLEWARKSGARLGHAAILPVLVKKGSVTNNSHLSPTPFISMIRLSGLEVKDVVMKHRQLRDVLSSVAAGKAWKPGCKSRHKCRQAALIGSSPSPLPLERGLSS